jgi:hypothetical protein
MVNGTSAVISPPLISPTNAPFGSVDLAMIGKVVSAAVAPHKAMAAKRENRASGGIRQKASSSRKKLTAKATNPISVPQTFATATPLKEYQPQALPIAAPTVIGIPSNFPTKPAVKALNKRVPIGSRSNLHPSLSALCQTSFCEPTITPTAKTIQQSAANPIPPAELRIRVGRRFSRASNTPAVKESNANAPATVTTTLAQATIPMRC